MNLKKTIYTLAAFAVALGANAELVTYPAGTGVTTLDDYTVEVRQLGNWEDVAVYPVKLAEVINGKTTVRTASMAYFDFDGEVEVRVIANYVKTTPDGRVESARVRPLSYGITPAVHGDTLTFSLSKPENISVEVNGNLFRNLHLFANPIDQHRPSAKTLREAQKQGGKKNSKYKDLIYFAPGIHHLPGDSLRIESGQTVYIDGGARVFGQLIVQDAENVRIYGRGEVHPEGRGEGVYIKNSRDVEAEGIIVTQIPVGGSDGVKIENVKSLSSYGWGDGMNVFASRNVHYNRAFCRNSDDCSTIYATRKGFTGGCSDILMENSTLWADVAHPIMVGIHGNVEVPDTIERVTYRNLDILDQQEGQLDYQGVFAINCGDENLIRDLTFDNIRIEQLRRGSLFNIRIFYNTKYCLAPGRGIHDILFKDITYNGTGDELSMIIGYNEERTVSGITFDNLVINGRHIYDEMPEKPKWYKTSDFARIFVGSHTSDIIFK